MWLTNNYQVFPDKYQMVLVIETQSMADVNCPKGCHIGVSSDQQYFVSLMGHKIRIY